MTGALGGHEHLSEAADCIDGRRHAGPKRAARLPYRLGSIVA